MSIAEKLIAVAENVPKVYEAGMSAEWHRFWDAFQLNGTRTAYVNAFYSAGDGAAGGGWTDELFKPKYDIKPVGACENIFFRVGAKDFTKNGCGVEIDFSQATNFNGAFYASSVEKVGVLDLRKVGTFNNGFAYCRRLKTIEKIILAESGSQIIDDGMFMYASNLEEIRFEGAIGGYGMRFNWSSKLSKASITSIINALYGSSSGRNVTLMSAAVTSAFGSTTAQEWLDLVATKPTWTISLV